MSKTPKALVIKFGGSNAINEQGANLDYLRSFLSHFVDEFSKYEKIAFVIGGGIRCRILQQEVSDKDEKDQVGIQSTWDHASQLREIVAQLGLEPAPSHPHSVDEAREMLEKYDVLVMGGLQIGQSTDAVAAYAAHRFAQQGYEPYLVVLSNVEKIYDKDPNKKADAKPIRKSCVPTLVKEGVLVDDPQSWVPGMAITIDPVAVNLLQNEQGDQIVPLYFGHGDDWENALHFTKGETLSNGTRLIPQQKQTVFWQ